MHASRYEDEMPCMKLYKPAECYAAVSFIKVLILDVKDLYYPSSKLDPLFYRRLRQRLRLQLRMMTGGVMMMMTMSGAMMTGKERRGLLRSLPLRDGPGKPMR